MSFVPPTENITVNYWRNADWWAVWPGDPTGSESFQFTAQLRSGTRTSHGITGEPHLPVWQLCTTANFYFYLPVFLTNEWYYYMDIVEAPAGSGFWYFVSDVYMVGAGFGNQYLALDLIATWFIQGGVWGGFAHWPYAPDWSFLNPATWPL